MLLRKLEVAYFGPFAYPTEIIFERTVTVFTGANDTGKSAVLRLLSYIGGGMPLKESDVNIHYLFSNDISSLWEQDAELSCMVTCELQSDDLDRLSKPIPGIMPGSEVDVQVSLAPAVKKYHIKKLRTNGERMKGNIQNIQQYFPNTVLITPGNKIQINSTIDLSKQLTKVERMFLNLTFGKNSAERLSRMRNELLIAQRFQQGAERLNSLVSQALPPSMQVNFDIRGVSFNPTKIGLYVKDHVGELTPFYMRGTGIQKIIGLLIYILSAKEQHPDRTLLLLIDEPENSLHADAQHALRYFLERLAESGAAQVVYATHSSAMLNPLSPQSIRLLRRERRENVATSVVDNKPIHNNFEAVRIGLGMLPTDSLLYAPVTVIVEGITEKKAIPALLLRLEKERKPSFEKVKQLLSMVYFLDGHGSNFELWCRMAEEQGVQPIIIVDADKERELQQQRVSEEHPSVPIILLGDREIEDIIPKQVYIKALANSLNKPQLTKDAFDNWLSQATPSHVQRMAFTKQIRRWLEDLNIEGYYKDEVMLKAIREVNLEDIDLQPFRDLVDHIADQLQSLMTPNPGVVET